MKDQALSMLHTIATFAPNDVNLLATKWGYPWPSQTDEKRLGFLIALLEDKGDQAMLDIAAIHPDREIICEAASIKKQQSLPLYSLKHNADGAPAVSLPVTPIHTTVIEATSPHEFSNGGRMALLIIFAGILFFFINAESK